MSIICRTVSGGGYFGGFLGALYRRVPDGQDRDLEVAKELQNTSLMLRTLRDNGRYIAPNGGGDLLLAGATLIRNWVAVLLVIILTSLAGALGIHLLYDLVTRVSLPSLVRAYGNPSIRDHLLHRVTETSLLAIVPLLLAVGFAIAYWLRNWWVIVGGLLLARLLLALLCACCLVPTATSWLRHALSAAMTAVAFALLLRILVWAAIRVNSKRAGTALSVKQGRLSLVTWVKAFAALSVKQQLNGLVTRVKSNWSATRTGVTFPDQQERKQSSHIESKLNNWLTRCLKFWLVVALLLWVLTLADMAGRCAYGVARNDWTHWVTAYGSLFGASSAASIAVRKWGTALLERLGKSVKISQRMIAGLVASLLAVVLTVTMSAIAHGASIGFAQGRQAISLRLELVWFLVTLLLTVAVGQIYKFVVASSLHPLYMARLVRSYLGVSNPRRIHSQSAGVTDPIAGDDLSLDEYYPPVPAGPLHLINVTVNETCDGRSKMQQQDRKGVGLAIGPAGLHLGVRHHALFVADTPFTKVSCVGPVASDPAVAATDHDGRLEPLPFRVFSSHKKGQKDHALIIDPMTIGAWIAISGAAFSTALGYRTSLSLSFLAGLMNVRLGYWWDSGTGDARLWAGLAHWAFPAQTQLFAELTARFTGTAGRFWYLTDGGHFENMGGYELIRRRLENIVIVDAEADPDYTFEGLVGLVRKARIDFGANIEFCDDPALQEIFRDPNKLGIGTLDALRPDQGNHGHSLAHAAIARITYDDESGSASVTRWLLYIKASLVGSEPPDVLAYRHEHGEFPHETTADQFFDEAQWESYRALGQTIARGLSGSSQAVVATSNEAKDLTKLLELFG